MKNKKLGIVGAAAVACTTLIIATSGRNIEVDYKLVHKNPYTTIMEINTPDRTDVDIAELYLNNELVDKTLLPNGEFKSIPLVFENLARLEIKFYKLGRYIGSAKFSENEVTSNE